MRNWETFSNPESIFLRSHINYNVTENFQPALGLEYHKSWTYAEDPDDKVSTNEFRTTLKVMLSFAHKMDFYDRAQDSD